MFLDSRIVGSGFDVWFLLPFRPYLRILSQSKPKLFINFENEKHTFRPKSSSVINGYPTKVNELHSTLWCILVHTCNQVTDFRSFIHLSLYLSVIINS